MKDKISDAARYMVAAQVVFWDATRQFEILTTFGGEWSAETNDKVLTLVEELAVGLAVPNDAEKISDKDLRPLLYLAKTPK